MAGALAIGFRSPPVPNKRHPMNQPHSIALTPIPALVPSSFSQDSMIESMEAPGPQNELLLSTAKVSGDPQDKLRSASKEHQASTQASGCAVQAATTNDVAVDIASEAPQSSTTQILIPSPILEPSNDYPVTDSTHAYSKQSCVVLETSVPTEQDTPFILNGTQRTENIKKVDAFEESSHLVGDATNRACHKSPELEPAPTSPGTVPESRREVHFQDAHLPESTTGHSNVNSENLKDIAHTECTSDPDLGSEEQAVLQITGNSYESSCHHAIDLSRSQGLGPVKIVDAMSSRPSSRAMDQVSPSRFEGDDSANPHSTDPLSIVPGCSEIALPATTMSRDKSHSSAANSGSQCSNPKETGPDTDSMPPTPGDTLDPSPDSLESNSSSSKKVDSSMPQLPTRDQSALTATEHVHGSITQSSAPPMIAAPSGQESPTSRTSNTACSKNEICAQAPTAGDPQDATDKSEHFPARSNDSNPDLQSEVHASPAAMNTLPVRKTPPQQAILSQLKAERGTLLASLRSLPAIQVLMKERAAQEAEGMSNDDAPSESDIMTAANEMVKGHIKLLHQYNELKDVGQGLMGLIADQRGLRIVEVQETFGIESQD